MTLLRDRHIDWVRARKFWTFWELNGLITPAISGQAEGAAFSSPTDTGIILREILTLGYVSVVFPAAGDVLHGYIRIPYDVDPAFDLGFRIQWTQSAAVTTSAGWILSFKVIKVGEVFTQADTLLSSKSGLEIAASATGGGNNNQWTSRGILRTAALDLVKSDIEAGSILVISIELDTIGSGMTDVSLLGLEMDYVPWRTLGSGSVDDRFVDVR